MAKRKSILKKAEVETAQRSRTCKYTGNMIASGQTCLVVFDGPRQRFCYSRGIGLKMIEDARQLLDQMEKQL